MKNFKNIFMFLLLSAVLTGNSNIFAQEGGKPDLNKKLAEIKGKVEKITVNVDGKDVVFEGKEAEKLAKRMKSNSEAQFYSIAEGKALSSGKSGAKTYKIITDEGDVVKAGRARGEDIVLTVVGEKDSDAVAKNIQVEKNDGNTKVTIITTDKDGKKTEKVLEGDEAEKYINENNDGVSVYMVEGKDLAVASPHMVKIVKGKPAKRIIIEKGEDDNNCCSSAVIIEKGAKVKKEVILKKIKEDSKTDKKEDK